MELSKDALKAIKSLNKEIKKQGISTSITISDETQELIEKLPVEQLIGVITHYAYFLYMVGQLKAGKSLPFEVAEIMNTLGLRE